MARLQALAGLLAFAIMLFPFPVLGDTAAAANHKPSATCSDWDLEEARITEQLAKEPGRVNFVVTGQEVAVFAWNMRWAFDIDVDADTLYIIEAETPGSTIKHVHLFTVRNHCITHYSLTWGAVIAEMLRYDAWERGNPHVDGQTDRTVPPGRPVRPVSAVLLPYDPPPPVVPTE